MACGPCEIVQTTSDDSSVASAAGHVGFQCYQFISVPVHANPCCTYRQTPVQRHCLLPQFMAARLGFRYVEILYNRDIIFARFYESSVGVVLYRGLTLCLIFTSACSTQQCLCFWVNFIPILVQYFYC